MKMDGLKRGILPAALTIALGTLPLPAMAQNVIPANTISTNGHGEVKTRPDSLRTSMTVETTADTLDKARSENNRRMQSVIAALKALNIPNLKLETQSVYVYPIQSDQSRPIPLGGKQLPKIIGYRASNSLEGRVEAVSPDDLGAYGSRIMDTALNTGANNVGGLNFYVADPSVPRVQALEAAVRDARRNAEAMARAANVTISGVYSIEGTPQYGIAYARDMYTMKAAGAAPEAAPMPVETGETTVTSDVTVRFKF